MGPQHFHFWVEVRLRCTQEDPRKQFLHDAALRTLVCQYTDNKTLLQSKHTSAVTNQKKAKVWANIKNAMWKKEKKKGLSLDVA